VPVDVPTLTNVNIGHFLAINFVNSELISVGLYIVVKLVERTEVHEITSVDCIVDAKLVVDAGVTSAH
jgi:hypothetical protein